MPEVRPPEVLLAGGQRVDLRRIKLFPAADVETVSTLRAHAAKTLGSLSSGLGIGVIGTPTATLAAEAAAIGVLSSLISSAAQKSALETLSQANNKFAALKRRGELFSFEVIAGLESPTPDAWITTHPTTKQTKTVNLANMTSAERKDFLAKHRPDVGYSYFGPQSITIAEPAYFIHSGEEFVTADTSHGPVLIRWNQIAGYFPSGFNP